MLWITRDYKRLPGLTPDGTMYWNEDLSTNVSPIIIILLFSLLTSTCATFTGSTMGSVYIFVPIAIAACMSFGLNPTTAAVIIFPM